MKSLKTIKIQIPYNIADIKKGMVLTVEELLDHLYDYIVELEDKLDDANDTIGELSCEIANLHEDIKEFYKPISSYERNGLSYSDF